MSHTTSGQFAGDSKPAMSLRAQCIEAASAAYLESWVEYDRQHKGKGAPVSVHMAVALDALLDTLTTNAEAWIRAAHEAGDLDDGMHRGDHALIDPLVAALREQR